MKRLEVSYNGHTYSRNALNLADLTEFGLRIMPLLAGFGGVTGVVYANKFEAGDNLHSFYEVVKDVFNKEDWKWLVNLMLRSKTDCLNIDGADKDELEIDEHFAGDFIAVYYVTCAFAWQNVGELKGLKEKLSGLFGNIVRSLEALLKNQLELVQMGLERKMSASTSKEQS